MSTSLLRQSAGRALDTIARAALRVENRPDSATEDGISWHRWTMLYDRIPLTDAEHRARSGERVLRQPLGRFADVVEVGLGSADGVLPVLSPRPSRPAPRRRLHRLHRIQLDDRIRRVLRSAQRDFELARYDPLFNPTTSAVGRGNDGRRGQ